MKQYAVKAMVFLIILGGLSLMVGSSEYENRPIPISPARDGGTAIVDRMSPTFSWSGIDGAISYKIAVFATGNSEGLDYHDMQRLAAPQLLKNINGRALSWTPSAHEALSAGGNYVWYVAAIDGSGNEIWSNGKRFQVVTPVTFASVQEELKKKLKESGLDSETINQVFSGVVGHSQDKGNKKADNGPIHGPLGTENANYTYYGIGAGGTSTAFGNSFFGVNAGNANTSGFSNSMFGDHAGANNTTGVYNTFLGAFAGELNTIGYENTFMGNSAGMSNTEGDGNVFLGYMTGVNNTTGNSNTFLGNEAGSYNTTGNSNTFIGMHSGYTNQTGNSNLFLGYYAGYWETGSNKLYIANQGNTPLIYGEFDNNILTINGNLGIGTTSPSSEIEISKSGVSPIFNIIRTDGAHFRLVAGRNNVQIGAVTDHGIKYLAGGSWKMQLNSDGTLSMADGGSYNGTWNDASSREFKENIEPIGSAEALAALKDLEPVKYNYKTKKEELRTGFIAEDVPELVASKDRKNLSAMDIVAVLTKVVKEQRRENQKLKKTIEAMNKRLEKLENQ